MSGHRVLTQLKTPNLHKPIIPGCSRKYTQASSTSTSLPLARKFCISTLRQHDTASWILLPYIPPHARDAFISLRVLNLQTAASAGSTPPGTTPPPSSGELIPALRTHYFQNLITSSLSGRSSPQPLSTLLTHAAQTAEWSPHFFTRLLTARSMPPLYPTLNDLEKYAEQTYSSMGYLMLQALGVGSVSADHVASHVGKAEGICAVLRGVPAGLGEGRIALPRDVLVKRGVKEEDVIRRGAEARGLRDAVFEVATRANDNLVAGRRMWEGGRGEGGLEAFLPGVATGLWLERLERVDFDVFHPKLRVTDWRLPWKVWWAWKKRRF
ncbi:hypothetical protein K470DRAFT_255267 [Piedraia hortae CBS 480.64]|uniref:Squalene/phytoene synthase n=1 Tax=Piedraia hortae CBS 480.64 TaxID=1314780 RepID=A0A6A7C7A9_9PEZI|nr:hypothetical protein K470DRAFT_255267 [Piedraia hortae CBS 480.64]